MSDIQSAAQWLGRLLIEEAKYLSGVEGKMNELRDELYWMQSFLREADGKQHGSAMARRWVSHIREFTYEAEDSIEEFLIHVAVKSRGRVDFLRWVKQRSKFIWKFILVRKILSNIDTLTEKISKLTLKLQTYNIKLNLEASSSSWLLRERKTFKNAEEKIMVGRDKDKEKLVDILLKIGTEGKSTVSICGDGGMGKTFLAKEVFHDKKIRKHFDAFAWAYVSKPCQSSAVQQELLRSLTSKSLEQISQMVDYEMQDELCKVQRKYKCFIVLDGLCEKQVWDNLKDSFPIANHKFGSKLLITNRLAVGEQVCPDAFTCKLEALDEDDSKKLLENVVTNPADYCDKKDHEDLEKLKAEMLKYCEGLPLAISVLAGVLATKKKLQEWKDVLESIHSFSFDDQHTSPKFGKSKRILELSYYELPYQLKPSFLYLGYFLTNMEIPTIKIMQLWEAEGLVSCDEEMAKYTTLEGVAEKFLAELVERSLVQVGSRRKNGEAKTCMIHDLMQELCISIASQDNMLGIKVVKHNEKKDAKKDPKLTQEKFYRLAIQYSTSTKSAKFVSDYKYAKHVRSLLFFNTLSCKEALMYKLETVLKEAFGHFKLLRVLDVENVAIHRLPKELGSLVYLRYLSIRGSWVTKLSKRIKYLECLQTLDLRVHPFVCLSIPDVIWRLKRLKHLYLPSIKFTLRSSNAGKLQLTDLKFLETLSNVSRKCSVKDVTKLISLRRFSSCGFLNDGGGIMLLIDALCSKLEHLEHVSLSLDGSILKANPNTLANCGKLRKLRVDGAMTESLGNLPNGLVKISLNHSELRSDPMQVLGKLPELKKLSLKNSAYLGTTMTCSKDAFTKLESLNLKHLNELVEWTVEAGAMQKLCRLKIRSCQKLKMIPEGLESIRSLKEMSISYMPWSFFRYQDLQKIKSTSRVPGLRVSYVLDDFDGDENEVRSRGGEA